MADPNDVLRFWLDETNPSFWYQESAQLDANIRERFEQLWWDTINGANGLWLTYPTGSLAYIILFDQFSRNMFRGQARAFAGDAKALAAAKAAIKMNWDKRIEEPARQFFYMPLMHSESLTDQDRAVRLFDTRMPQGGKDQISHARAHREQIRRFGRFPGRNDALGRRPTALEAAFQADGGYRELLNSL